MNSRANGSSGSRSVAHRFRAGSWQQDLPEIALHQALSSESSTDWILFLQITDSIRGIAPEEWNRVAKYCLSATNRSPRLVLQLLNSALQKSLIDLINSEYYIELELFLQGLRSKWLSHALRGLKLQRIGSSVFDYPLLLDKFYSIGKVSKHCRKEIQRYQSASNLLAQTSAFETRIADVLQPLVSQDETCERPTVAVVGNAPHILNKQQGQEIDSADVVIRFNQIGLNERTVAHTGTRTDVWIMSPSIKPCLCPPTANTIVVSGIHPITRPSGYWTALAHIGKALCEFETGIWYNLVRLFDAPPTAGALTLASLKSMSMNLDVKCYGFTFDYKAHSTTANHHADKHSRSTRHNWRAESDWLLENYR